MIAHSQPATDTIMIVKNRYILDGKLLTPKQLLVLTKDQPEAYAAMKKAKTNWDLGMACGYIGGFCIGYSLGTALAGGEPEWALAGFGAGIILLAIPLGMGYKKHSRAAIRIYNSNIRQISRNHIKIDFGLTGYGIGLRCQL